MTPSQWLITADLAADLGNRLVSLALLDLLVFKGADPMWGLVGLTLAQQMPSIVLSPIAGAAADRIGAGRWLAGALVGKGLLAMALALSLQTQAVFLLYFCFISGSICFNVGRLAIMPRLVPPHRLMAYNAFNESVAVAGDMASYALMGTLIAFTGQRGALQIAALIFLAAFGSSLRLIPCGADAYRSRQGRHRPRPAISEDDFRYDLKTRVESGPLFRLLGILVAAGGLFNFALPMVYKSTFGGDIAHWGVLMALYQAGAFVAALLLRRYSASLKWRIMLASAFTLTAGSMAALDLPVAPIGMGLLMVLTGSGFTLGHIILESKILLYSPGEQRGKTAARVLQLRGLLYCGFSLAGAGLSIRWTPEDVILVSALMLLIGVPLTCIKRDNHA